MMKRKIVNDLGIISWLITHTHTQKVFEGLDHKNKSDIAAAQSSFELYFQQKFQFSFGSTNLKACHKTVMKPNEKWSLKFIITVYKDMLLETSYQKIVRSANFLKS